MMRRQSIPWVLTTSKSIEEIATTVLQTIRSDKTILG
jgi:regulator of PEP synthase PpsR (kinase-PPPase family)